MGLDVYVGSLTRYYAGNWETVLQQAARQGGTPVHIIRPKQGRETWLSRLVGRLRGKGVPPGASAVDRWHRRVSQQLGLPELSWNEDPKAPYFTDKPAWDCYGALVLWAAYEEQPTDKRRDTAEGWHEDPAYLAASANSKSRFRHLLAGTELWLPIDLPSPFERESVIGQPIAIGSSIRLLEELKELNRVTWGAADPAISTWRFDGAPHGAPLEVSARFGFAVFYELANTSVEHRLPMKLDY